VGTSQIRTLITSVTSGQTVGVTPITEIATQTALATISSNTQSTNTGLTSLISAANTAVATQFGLTDITIPPAINLAAGTAPASAGAAAYAVALAGISQLAATTNAAGGGGGTANSLGVMQALATAMTYNGNLNGGQVTGAVAIPIPGAPSGQSLSTLIGASTGTNGTFATKLNTAMTTFTTNNSAAITTAATTAGVTIAKPPIPNTPPPSIQTLATAAAVTAGGNGPSNSTLIAAITGDSNTGISSGDATAAVAAGQAAQSGGQQAQVAAFVAALQGDSANYTASEIAAAVADVQGAIANTATGSTTISVNTPTPNTTTIQNANTLGTPPPVTVVSANVKARVTTVSPSLSKAAAFSTPSNTSAPRSLFQRLFGVKQRANAGNGCTVSIFPLVGGGAALATGTTDSNGDITISSPNFVAGHPYTAVSNCGSDGTFTSLIGADNNDPTSKSPAPMDPNTTLASQQTLVAINSAISSATGSGAGAANSAAVAASILTPSNVNNINAAVSATVQSALDFGAVQPPTGAAGAAMAAGMTSATPLTASSAQNSYGKHIPPTISGQVSGAASAAAAFPGCDSSLPSSIANQSACTQAIAKMMFNVVHFPVLVRADGAGAFGTFTCSASDATLKAAFGSSIQAMSGTGTTGDLAGIDPNLCYVMSTVPGVDRNASYSANGGGGGGGGNPAFGETCPTSICSTVQIHTGTLTAISTALLANYNYTLSNLDNFIFNNYDGNSLHSSYAFSTTNGGLGFNGRLINQAIAYSWTDPGSNMGNYSYSSSTFGLLTNSSSLTGSNSIASFSWPTCNSSPCDPNSNGVFTFTTGSADWATATGTNASLATALKNGFV